MTLENRSAKRRKLQRRQATRTEAAASRGGGSSAPAGVPVRRKTYGRSWMFGSLGPHRSVTRKTFAARRRHECRGQGLASWEHLARSNPERKPAKAKRDLRLPRRRTSDVTVIRDGLGGGSERDQSLPLPQGSRRSNRLQRKASLGQRSERKRHGAFVEVTEVVQARVRSAERPKGTKRDRG
jgi:hypothetical protein